MTRPGPRIGSELIPVVLILACLAGTWALVVSMYRRAAADRRAARVVVQAPPIAARVEPPPPPPPPVPEPKPEPAPPPPEDPTRKELARIGSEEAEQILAAREADRKAAALEQARQAAVAESERWRRREMMARAQLDDLDARARSLEEEADALALERDVLARERDAAKAALAKAQNRSGSYAVLPHKGPNGTWQRPIILECRNGAATLQPGGPTFSLLDMSPLLSPRSSPLIVGVLREMIRTRGMATPDGAPSVPYIFFLVRPDGIRPYYEARARLEPLGIAFGYELVDQEMEVEYPDLENLAEWDGTPPPLSSSPALADATGPTRGPTPSRPTAAPGAGAIRPTRSSGRRGPRAPSAAPTSRPPTDPPPSWGTGGAAPGSARAREGPARGSSEGAGGSGSGAAGGTGRGGVGAGRGMGRGGTGLGADPGLAGGGGSGPYSGRPGGPAARPGMDPAGGLAENAGGGGGREGLVPLSPDRLPGLEEAEGSSRPGGNGTPPRPRSGGAWSASGTGAKHGEPGTVGPNQADGPPDGSGPGSGSRGTGPRRVVAGTQGGGPPMPDLEGPAGLGQFAQGQGNGSPGDGSPGGGSQGPTSGVPVGLGSLSPGGGSPGSGQPPMGVVSGLTSSGSGERRVPTGEPPIDETRPPGKPLKIDAPLEIVVACGPTGVVLHPGGYRISKEVLTTGKEPLLARQLATILRLRQQVDPMIRPVPSLRFLVEPEGYSTYREARRQTVLSGLNWPVALQVGDAKILDFSRGEPF